MYIIADRSYPINLGEIIGDLPTPEIVFRIRFRWLGDRVLAATAPSADEGVNRIGIKAIELLQGSSGFRGAFSRGGGNQSPLGRVEAGPPPAVE